MATPAALRDKASQARRLARAIMDTEAARRLNQFAAELDAKAAALEAGEVQGEGHAENDEGPRPS